ncbi:MAG: aldehyde dehydrogenase [Alistipes sp.]|nr:aldehyde dehydrogenase [Alistipes sp.]
MNSNAPYTAFDHCTLPNTPPEAIQRIVAAQRTYFRSGATRSYAFRRQQLTRLEEALHTWEKPLTEALWHDLHKSYEEAYLTELSIVLGEIRNHRRHLRRWMRPCKVCSPLKMFPSRSRILTEPLGSALIIAPWNYPVQLLLNPLIGAISAGCTALLKPSPYVPHTSQVIEQLIRETFDEQYIAVVQGNREVNGLLLAERFDRIFFTGSPALGRRIMEAAAVHLTPVILELGGKSPCIVDEDADLRVAARRIAWGKSLNAGQTCIAPDYLLLHEAIREPFLNELERAFHTLLGADASQSRHFARIINERAFDRLSGYLTEGRIRFGGRTNRQERFIEPTVLEEVAPTAKVLQEEIFGPILPVVTVRHIEEAITHITEREKPLALYYFGEAHRHEVLQRTSSGGACLNDTMMQIANERLPFGGVGQSGMGRYHGYDSYLAFSHRRSVVSTTTRFDLPLRYMPYGLFRWIKGLL